MGSRRNSQPGMARTALVHGGLSLSVFATVSGMAGAGVAVFGNPEAAGPVYVASIFDAPGDAPPPALKRRFASNGDLTPQLAALQVSASETGSAPEPSLGVADVDPPRVAPAELQVRPVDEPSGRGDVAPAPTGVRINGKTVLPGESYSEVEALDSLPDAPIEGLYEQGDAGQLPRISAAGRAPADAYARPFYNRGNAPTVAVVLGGLGINYTHTINAIEELPPEVTLSFAPHARGLQTWVRRARRDGHEVLIELPLEPFDHGRVRPHSNTLETGLDPQANIERLERVLALASGYFGVINYQGDKFAKDREAVKAMLAGLKARGLAFVEDGSLPSSEIGEVAGEMGARYVGAQRVIDARIDTAAMREELMALEARARQDGRALGTAIAYPLTIDALKAWTESLEDSDVRLAPASALQSVAKAQPVQQVADEDVGVNVPGGAGSLP